MLPVEILLSNYCTMPLKRLAINEWPPRSFKVIGHITYEFGCYLSFIVTIVSFPIYSKLLCKIKSGHVTVNTSLLV